MNKEYENKYVSKEVCNFTIYDKNTDLIININTVREDELIIARNKYFLRINDALIDKTFLDYLAKNPNFEGYIKATNIYRNLDCIDNKVDIDIPNAKLVNYRVTNICGEVSTVNIVFELFIDTEKEYAFDVKLVEE